MQSRQRTHDWARALVFLLGMSLLILAEVENFTPWRHAELIANDWLIRLGRLTVPNPDLVFLAIDEPSIIVDVSAAELTASPELQKMKASGWPWSRDIYASIIDKLTAAGAKVVALDILFPTPREGDAPLQKTLEQRGDRVVVGSTFVDTDHGTAYMGPASSLVPNPQAGPAVGFVNYWPDVDAVVRHIFFRRTASEVNGDLPFAGERAELSLPARILQRMGREADIRSSRSGEMIRFTKGVREGGGFSKHSIYQLFLPEFWNGTEFRGGAYFRDKVVLIGPEGAWSKDYLSTSFSQIPGPLMHLHVVNAALHHEIIGDVSPSITATWMAIAGLLAWFAAIRVTRADVRLLVLVVITLGALAAAGLIYNGLPGFHARSLPVLGVVVALLGLSAIWIAWDQLFEMRERRRVRRTLERYVSKNLVREILDNPQSYFNTVGGVRKAVAVMFTDLRGFTTLTEQADSQQIVAQLNEYFNEMVRHVFEQLGTLDKFIGDAIMAEWGNLHSEGPRRDVERAIAAALAMREGLERLNARWGERGWPQFGMGIGINHGDVIVGNIGSSTGIEKMDPTVIGDAVNLASRLEGLTKEYGVDLLLGESAGKLAMESYYVREIDFVVVKGRSQPAAIYEVIAPRTATLDETTRWRLERFAQALADYRAGRFAEAQSGFSECWEKEHRDLTARMFARRCEQLLATPPEGEWNGVYVMTKK